MDMRHLNRTRSIHCAWGRSSLACSEELWSMCQAAWRSWLMERQLIGCAEIESSSYCRMAREVAHPLPMIPAEHVARCANFRPVRTTGGDCAGRLQAHGSVRSGALVRLVLGILSALFKASDLSLSPSCVPKISLLWAHRSIASTGVCWALTGAVRSGVRVSRVLRSRGSTANL
jgi:hypothetical protein